MQYSPGNMRVACHHRGLTHFGDVYFFHEFLRRLQFRSFLALYLTYPRLKRRYRLSQIIPALLYPIVRSKAALGTLPAPRMAWRTCFEAR
jgi:hypothetical protein